MKFLAALALVFILAILFGLIDISPLLAQISGPHGGIPSVPADGLQKFLHILGFSWR